MCCGVVLVVLFWIVVSACCYGSVWVVPCFLVAEGFAVCPEAVRDRMVDKPTVSESANGQHIRDKLLEASEVLHHQFDLNY